MGTAQEDKQNEQQVAEEAWVYPGHLQMEEGERYMKRQFSPK